jgi:predicted RNA binding protein YcfA (HicA-like mRNA interferase family)
MGSKYPILPPEEVIKILVKLDFYKVSQKGSHAKYIKDGNPKRIVIVPMHYELAKGTLKSILEQAGITLQEFLEYFFIRKPNLTF